VIAGEVLAGPLDQGAWPHRSQHGLGLGGGQRRPGATGDQLDQQPVQPVHGGDPLLDQLLAAIGQQPQHGDRVV
jgi:hypothetical protein